MKEHNMDKTSLIKKFRRHDNDSGSSEVQAALLTGRINRLASHLAIAKKDFISKRGLRTLVSQRKKALEYLEQTDAERYKLLIERLGIRK